MKNHNRVNLYILLLALGALFTSPGTWAADKEPGQIKIDIPVVLKEAKVLFNMDHPVFAGDTPVGLIHMNLMTQGFNKNKTHWKMVAVFHGAMGYALLNDDAYNKARKTQNGNPYMNMIQHLIREGVQVEECGFTMKGNGWTNSDLLPGVKVNSGAEARIVQLVQEGYVALHP